jgi:hypothetical protein
MILLSSMRRNAFGSIGDWPCLADRMIVVDVASPSRSMRCIIAPTCAST